MPATRTGTRPGILSILEQYDGSNMTMAQGLYATTKYALARWVRRISASWGANGVRINAVAPGNVRTPLTAAMGDRATAALAGLPIPINYQTGDQLLDPVTSPMCWCFWCPRRPTASTATSCS